MSLKIHLVGEMSFYVKGEAVPSLRSRTATALLIYLAYNPQSFSREYLATFFWPDKTQEQAMANLRSTIRLLRPDFEPYLTITRKAIEFNETAKFASDAIELENQLDQLLASPSLPKKLSDQLRETLSPLLATDEAVFMPGFYLTNSPKFERWMASVRRQLQQKVEIGMQHLVRGWINSGSYQTALPYAKRLAELDPYDEIAQQLVMEVLWRTKQKNEALRHYKTFANLLARELDILPSEETIALRSRIRAHKALPTSHLPLQTTPFIGRDSELSALFNQLMEPTCRLLTIFGPGGIGKTRLLIALGQLLCSQFPGRFSDGIFYIPLVQLSSARYLTTAIITGLDLTLSGETSPQEQLLSFAKGKEIALLLDNVEHLLTDSAESEEGIQLLEMLIQAAPALKIVTTSRSKLNLAEEWIFGLDGLRLPPESWEIAPAEIDATDGASLARSYPATDLFVATGRRMVPQFEPTMSNIKTIGHICHLLDGLPLGIEMSSALLDHLTPSEIEQKIIAEASKLASRLRNIPDRHRSLWGVFNYSYQQLSRQAQASFCQLSIFNSPFDEEAAKAVAGASTKLLRNLANQSLLNEIPSEDEITNQYEMHRLLRQFAAEQLAQDPELEQNVKGSYVSYFINFLFQRVESIRQGGPPATLDSVEKQISDIRGIWSLIITQSTDPDLVSASQINQNILSHDDQEKVERALEALLTFYFGKSLLAEGLEIAGLVSSLKPRSELSLRGALWQAEFQAGLGEYNLADELFNEVLEHSRQFGSKLIETEAINGLGRVQYFKGDMQGAEELFQTGLLLAYQEEDAISISLALNCLANTLAASQMAYDKTVELLSEALDISQLAGDQLGAARALINLGTVAQERDKLEKAQTLYQQSLELYRNIGYEHGIAAALNYLGQIAILNEDFAGAQKLLDQSLDLYLGNGNRRGEADCLCQIGNIARGQGEIEKALNYYEEALAIAQTIGGELLVLTILYEVAALHNLRGWPEPARQVAGHIIHHPAVGDEVAALAQGLLDETEKEGNKLDPQERLTLGQMIEFALAV